MNFKAWTIFLILIGVVAGFFLGKAGWEVIGYLRLNAATEAHVKEWSIKESSSDFLVAALYTYKVKNQEFEAKTIFTKPKYLNFSSAQSDLKKWDKHQWTAWYSSFSPKNSSLQKIFPFKSCIQALLSLGVWCYFLFLRRINSLKESGAECGNLF